MASTLAPNLTVHVVRTSNTRHRSSTVPSTLRRLKRQATIGLVIDTWSCLLSTPLSERHGRSRIHRVRVVSIPSSVQPWTAPAAYKDRASPALPCRFFHSVPSSFSSSSHATPIPFDNRPSSGLFYQNISRLHMYSSLENYPPLFLDEAITEITTRFTSRSISTSGLIKALSRGCRLRRTSPDYTCISTVRTLSKATMTFGRRRD